MSMWNWLDQPLREKILEDLALMYHNEVFKELKKELQYRRKFLRFFRRYEEDVLGMVDDVTGFGFCGGCVAKEYYCVLRVFKESRLYWEQGRCLDTLVMWDKEEDFSDQGALNVMEVMTRYYGK
jgi:hypothetical protein